MLKEYEDTLNGMRTGDPALAGLRNDLVHEYGVLQEFEEEKDIQQEVEDVVNDAIEFIEDVELRSK